MQIPDLPIRDLEIVVYGLVDLVISEHANFCNHRGRYSQGCGGEPKVTKPDYKTPTWVFTCDRCGGSVGGENLPDVVAAWNEGQLYHGGSTYHVDDEYDP